MRIGLITTLNRNIGDDFIRDGIVQVLQCVYAGVDLEFIAIDKHAPFTVYPRWHPLRWVQTLDRAPRGKRVAEHLKSRADSTLYRLGGSLFDSVDLVVQCGAPVMWPGCHRCEWATPLWDHVVGRIYHHTPTLNLAAGSSYPWERVPDTVTDSSDASFLGRVLNYCRVTTGRDPIVSQLAASLGFDIPAIPCSAFLTGRRFDDLSSGDGPLLINYMPGGGHFEWGQDIDFVGWESTVRSLVDRLSTRHPIAFLCHNKEEYRVAGRVAPGVVRFLPNTIDEYFRAISSAKAALCNRLHASIALASLGIPSISVGTDTRMLMIDQIGSVYHYVKEVGVAQLEHEIEDAISRRKAERDRLLTLREVAWTRYIKVVAEAIV